MQKNEKNRTLQTKFKCVGCGEMGTKWHFEPENSVTERREDCFVHNYQQYFNSKGTNIKIAVMLVNSMLLS